MSERPLIGIPLCLDETGRWHAEREVQYIDVSYARAVEEAGGVPVHLPIQQDAEPLFERIDGLLLPGGDDLPAPQPYPDVSFQLVPERQLRFDRSLLALALESDRPVLGICYGMQLIALHFGGSLHYHLPVDQPDAGPHRLAEGTGTHAIEIVPRTRLEILLGNEPGPVNSLHHQAVSEPGVGLRVSARAKDGVIEAIEPEASRFWIGVQWHPEKMTGVHREALFGAFVDACARSRARPRPSA